MLPANANNFIICIKSLFVLCVLCGNIKKLLFNTKSKYYKIYLHRHFKSIISFSYFIFKIYIIIFLFSLKTNPGQIRLILYDLQAIVLQRTQKYHLVSASRIVKCVLFLKVMAVMAQYTSYLFLSKSTKFDADIFISCVNQIYWYKLRYEYT